MDCEISFEDFILGIGINGTRLANHPASSFLKKDLRKCARKRHGRLPDELCDAQALARWVAICTGALPCGLRGARTLARRVLHALWIAGCTGACQACFAICKGALPCGLRVARALARCVLQYAQAHT
ncbi:hypothetical protein CDL15_Pgr026272 [Punica granatum]|uniref:Uncharacterized protein n=1 Tax=Punica granatum TaxID=22663 RepID=A0A218XWX2_PUNGR|nr:hypothetical protein CDL15_Pgr026272 [Punica granatum]